MSNVLSPRDLVSRPDNMDETVPHTHSGVFFASDGSYYAEFNYRHCICVAAVKSLQCKLYYLLFLDHWLHFE